MRASTERRNGFGLDHEPSELPPSRLTAPPRRPEAASFELDNVSRGAQLRPARLVLKRLGSQSAVVIRLSSNPMVLGRFDPTTGPVDIDLTSLPGSEHLSRRHAEFSFSPSGWSVHDLNSTNGVFVRRSGQVAATRINQPTVLHSGDEASFGEFSFVFEEE
ncbi:MAG TPA: FHA domain-containing protein [Chloroflexota bacterium]|nr:FHA domain-containing protein [Chloroflexota bacterium]